MIFDIEILPQQRAIFWMFWILRDITIVPEYQAVFWMLWILCDITLEPEHQSIFFYVMNTLSIVISLIEILQS